MKPISDEAFELLMGILEQHLALNPRFKTQIRPLLFETTYKKGSRILNFNQVQQLVWFMMSGLAREIRVNALTFDENTVWFWREGSFLYTNPGFFSQEPSQSTIEILADCTVVFISYEDWIALKSTLKEAESITEKIRGANEQLRLIHADNLRNLNTAERYLEERGTLNKIFPYTKLQYIAEYMGMSVDRLGKLRRKY